MARFMIHIGKVSGELNNIEAIENVLGKYEEQIKEIEKEIGSTGGAYRT